ncbi:MAG: SDR family oxidoreductase, partial [Bacteroidota bacterium]
MYIVLTGSTGTLGSQVLFSLLESRWDTLEKVFLIVRKKKQISAHS